jgi:hypothetical protein
MTTKVGRSRVEGDTVLLECKNNVERERRKELKIKRLFPISTCFLITTGGLPQIFQRLV